jgi:hypothetical protein
MNPTDVLSAAVWVGSAGGVCAVIVQLAKLAIGDDTTPRQKVLAATLAAAALTLAYAASNGLFVIANIYGLLVGWITIAATGAGLQSAITATATNKPQ